MTQIKHLKNSHNGEGNEAAFTSYEGPLPPPAMLEEYSRCIHGAGDLILNEFKKQGSHRRMMEKSIVAGKLYLGPLLAFFTIITAFILGFQLLMAGKNIEGFVAFLGPIGILVGVFVWNHKKGS